MLIESSRPLTVRFRTGIVELKPGQPVELPESEALRLLAKAKGKVRLVESNQSMEIEPAAENARPVYWEQADGIVGPARPLFLGRYGNTFLVVAEYEGDLTTINADVLRSKKAFEAQVPLRPVELVREPQ